MSRRFAVLAGAAVCVACSQQAEHPLRERGPSHSAVSAASFAFLPPLAADPQLEGALDTTLSPEVRITDSSGALIAQFTAAGSGAQRVRADADCNCWIVNWPTGAGTGERRIAVSQAGVDLGAIDVFVADPKHKAPAGTVALNAGRTVPIKFFASAPVGCPGDLHLCSGHCADFASDRQNCGGCGISCTSEQQCTASGCVDVCTFPPQANDLVAVDIEPTATNLIAGVHESEAFHVYGIYRDHYERVDITSQVTFSIDSAGVIGGANGSLSLATGAAPGMAHLTATVGSYQLSANVRVWDPARYAAISTLATNIGGGWGTFNSLGGSCFPIQLVATFSDGTTEDVSASAVWTTDRRCMRVLDQELLDIIGCPGQNPDVGWYTGIYGSLYPSSLAAPGQILYVGGHGTCADPRVPGAPVAVWTSPSQASLAVGEAAQFGAWAMYADESLVEATNRVSFRTCNPATADMAPDGWATALAIGTSQVAAQMGSLAGVANLNMSATPDLGTVQSMYLDPSAANVPPGATYRLKAFATYSNTGPYRFFNVSRQTAWASTDHAVLADPFNGFGVGPAAPGRGTVTASFGGRTFPGSVRAWDAARLASITSLSPAWNIFMGQGQCQQLHAIATFGGNPADTEDVTSDVTWKKLDGCFGTLSPSGYYWTNGPFCAGYWYQAIRAYLGFGLPFAASLIGAGPDSSLPWDYRDPLTCSP